MTIPLESVDLDTFSPLVGHAFVTAIGDARLELRLDAVQKLGYRRTDASRDPFSLTFRGQQGLRLPQGIYHFACDGLGEIGLFITQTGDGRQGSDFEAIFT